MNHIDNKHRISAAEFVGSGHPDKIADQIAEAIVEKATKNHKYNQVACEILVSKNLVVIAGEITIDHSIDPVKIASEVLERLNYVPNNFKFVLNLNTQSEDIRNSSIVKQDEIISGDQSIVFGYACNETDEYLPLAYVLSRDIVKKTESLIKKGQLPWAKYDMKCLVSLDSTDKQSNKTIQNLIFSIQHDCQISKQEIISQITENVLNEVIFQKHHMLIDSKNVIINSSDAFVVGGLDADSGMNNRKILIDNYGDLARNGGGGFNGKDLTKIDRLGAYFARWICKNLVAASICNWIELKIIYFFGSNAPLKYSCVTDSECKYSDSQIIKAIKDIFPQSIDEVINLFLKNKINFQTLSTYGHFGHNDLDLPWESLDKVSQIKSWFSKT